MLGLTASKKEETSGESSESFLELQAGHPDNYEEIFTGLKLNHEQ